MSMESRNCVVCHQLLPDKSKLTLASVSPIEAKRNGWARREDSVVGQFEFFAAFASRSSTSFTISLLCEHVLLGCTKWKDGVESLRPSG